MNQQNIRLLFSSMSLYVKIYYSYTMNFLLKYAKKCSSYLIFICIFVLGPKREVISIYNENFTTPQFRSPYFIEVYRCVALATIDDEFECGSDNYPVPHNWTEIEIVVPDLSNEEKFYKFIIYNHTSCTCGGTPEIQKKFRNDTVELGESVMQYNIGIFTGNFLYSYRKLIQFYNTNFIDH